MIDRMGGATIADMRLFPKSRRRRAAVMLFLVAYSLTMGLGGCAEDREFAQRLLAVLDEGRAQRPCTAQLAQKQIDAGLLG